MKIGIIKALRHKALVADRCPVCQLMAEQTLTFRQGIFVLGFPVFPTEKSADVKCAACGTEYGVAQAPPFVSAKYNELQPTIRTPVWAYSFLIIMGALMLFAFIKSPFDQNKMNKRIDKPQVGDVYEVRSDAKGRLIHTTIYTNWKVVGYTADSISLVRSMYEVDDAKDRGKLKSHAEAIRWRDDTTSYAKEWLCDRTGIFNDDPHITDIERPETSH